MTSKFIQRLAEATYRASEGKQKHQIDEIALRALSLLKSKRMLNKVSAYFSELASVRRHEEKIVEAIVESRHPLSPNELRTIRDYLKRTTRREVIITAHERKDLLGGFRVRYDDVILEATVDSHIKQLAHHLTS